MALGPICGCARRTPLDIHRAQPEASEIVDREGVVGVEHLQARAALLRHCLLRWQRSRGNTGSRVSGTPDPGP